MEINITNTTGDWEGKKNLVYSITCYFLKTRFFPRYSDLVLQMVLRNLYFEQAPQRFYYQTNLGNTATDKK